MVGIRKSSQWLGLEFSILCLILHFWTMFFRRPTCYFLRLLANLCKRTKTVEIAIVLNMKLFVIALKGRARLHDRNAHRSHGRAGHLDPWNDSLLWHWPFPYWKIKGND